MPSMHQLFVMLIAGSIPLTLHAQDRTPDITDSLLRRHVWAVVTDSLSGGGSRADVLHFADDSLSRAVFRAAGATVRSLDNGSDISCPGSTDATGAPLAGPVGYRVQVDLTARPDSASFVLGVSKTCRFVFRGAVPRPNSGFAEGMSWELRRENGMWRVGRRLVHVIT